jgi:hypothetical protein
MIDRGDSMETILDHEYFLDEYKGRSTIIVK